MGIKNEFHNNVNFQMEVEHYLKADFLFYGLVYDENKSFRINAKTFIDFLKGYIPEDDFTVATNMRYHLKDGSLDLAEFIFKNSAKIKQNIRLKPYPKFARLLSSHQHWLCLLLRQKPSEPRVREVLDLLDKGWVFLAFDDYYKSDDGITITEILVIDKTKSREWSFFNSFGVDLSTLANDGVVSIQNDSFTGFGFVANSKGV